MCSFWRSIFTAMLMILLRKGRGRYHLGGSVIYEKTKLFVIWEDLKLNLVYCPLGTITSVFSLIK